MLWLGLLMVKLACRLSAAKFTWMRKLTERLGPCRTPGAADWECPNVGLLLSLRNVSMAAADLSYQHTWIEQSKQW